MTELLEGLKVLDLSLWQPGHTATQYLADLGADVLKVEPPGGDRMRVLTDRFVNFNGHKRSVALDLKLPEDQTRLHDLVRQAEVVVEGYRPGVAERLGAGYAQLAAVNPAIVYCSISGFGQVGPLAQASGHDANYQAYAGAFVTPEGGGPPVSSGALIGDQGAGLAAAFGILAAVLCARRTGRGEHIDVSMADLLVSWVAPMAAISETDVAAHRNRGRPGMAPYATADGRYVFLGIFSEDHFWDALCRAFDLPDYVGLNMADRAARADELTPALAARFAARDRDAVLAELGALGVPIAPILSREEALAEPHFTVRGVIARGPDGDRRVAHPIRYRNHPARAPGRPPQVGEGGEGGFAD